MYLYSASRSRRLPVTRLGTMGGSGSVRVAEMRSEVTAGGDAKMGTRVKVPNMTPD